MARGVLRAAAVAALLFAVTVGCSCSRDDRPQAPVVTVDMRQGWTDPGPDPDGINTEADKARANGNDEVADVLVFYSDMSRGVGDVLSVVVASDGRAALAVRRHDNTTTPLDQVVDRHVGDVKAQGGSVNATRMDFHAVPAWEVVFTNAPAGLRDVTYWFDRAGGRFTVEITGAEADVAALAEAVRIT
jgi:hypothetical protein